MLNNGLDLTVITCYRYLKANNFKLIACCNTYLMIFPEQIRKLSKCYFVSKKFKTILFLKNLIAYKCKFSFFNHLLTLS